MGTVQEIVLRKYCLLLKFVRNDICSSKVLMLAGKKYFLRNFLFLGMLLLLMTGCRSNCCEPCVQECEFPFVYEFQFQRCCPEACLPICCEEENDYVVNDFDEDYLYEEEITIPLKYEPAVGEYRVAVGDVLEISVFDEEETITAEVTVAPDGKIYYLFLEGVEARGLTLSELKNKMSEKLTNLFINPTVSIIPRIMLRDTFIILGRVVTPGVYPLTQRVTVRQALGLAGGLMTDQVGSSINVRSRERGGQVNPNVENYMGTQVVGRQNLSSLRDSFLIRDGKKLPINFEELVYSGDMSQDIPLHAGDYIYIASNEQRNVYVLGDGIRSLALPYVSEMTLMGSLAAAGGWNDIGPYGSDVHRVLVLRGMLDCPEVLVADVEAILAGWARDVYLEPGDIIYVNRKPFSFIRELVDLAVYTFYSSFANFAGTYYGDKWFFNGIDDD